VLLLNCHISSQRGRPIHFPATPDGLPDNHAIRLFEMSSVMPPVIRSQAARTLGRYLDEGARGFVFQADMAAVALFVEVGGQGAFLTKGSNTPSDAMPDAAGGSVQSPHKGSQFLTR
jgi:hypothetical protein